MLRAGPGRQNVLGLIASQVEALIRELGNRGKS
jgi:hypothetical protein